jgi:hypothetical protein
MGRSRYTNIINVKVLKEAIHSQKVFYALFFLLLFALSCVYVYSQETRKTNEFDLLHLIDEVDVGDEGSEKNHEYRITGLTWQGIATYRYNESGNIYYALDDGKSFTGSEEFIVSSRKGKDLYIIKRTDLYCTDQVVNLSANGHFIGPWRTSEGWLGHFFHDVSYRIPAESIDSDNTTIRSDYISGAPDVTSYRYWIAVKEADTTWLIVKSFKYAFLAFIAVALLRFAYRRMKDSFIPKTLTENLASATGVILIVGIVFGTYLAILMVLAYILLQIYRRPLIRTYKCVSTHRAFPLALFAFSLIIVIMISYLVFLHHSIVEPDEQAYTFQAKLLSRGLISMPSPKNLDLYASVFFINDGRFFPKYSPGHALMLAAGVLLGSEWLIPPILAAATVVLILYIGEEMYGGGVGKLAALLCVSSTYFLLMSSTLLSQTTSLFFLAAFTLAYIRAAKADGYLYLILAGFSLGMAFLTRQLTTIVYVTPFALYSMFELFFHRASLSSTEGYFIGFNKSLFKRLCVLTLVFLIIFSVQLAYNKVQTGAALLFPFIIPEPSKDAIKVSFSKTCEDHNAFECLWNTLYERYNARRQSVEILFDTLLSWPFNSLFFIAVLFLTFGFNKWDIILASIVPMLVFSYSFYFQTLNNYGPLYYYEAILPLLLLVARGIYRANDLLSGLFRKKPFLRDFFAIWVLLLIVSGYRGLFYDNYSGCASSYDDRCNVFEIRDTISLRKEPYILAERLGLRDAVVFVKPTPYEFYIYNSPFLDDPVIFTYYQSPERNGEIMDLFPKRKCYSYEYSANGSRIYPCE